MPGFRKFRRNSFLKVCSFFAFIGFLGIACGCGGTDETSKAESSDAEFRDFLLRYERTFNPSRYNPDINTVKLQESGIYSALHAASVYTYTTPETIPGFRVQAFLTQQIEQALAVRDTLSSIFEDELVYMVYDAPYYKIRIGNYLERPAADPMVKKLIRLGYKDAWIVPDNVLKNPPAKLPDLSIEPKNPLQRSQ